MRLARSVKAVADRLLAVVLLVLLSPVLAIVAVWIAADDGFPILFVQPRAGKGGVPFRMLKFRTLVRDAIRIGHEQQLSADPFGIVANDPRITRAGRVLRRTGLDELPQLVNILRGQMSLVGPRPDLVEQAAHYTEHDRRRLAVLPGLTGWSQIHGRDEIQWPERIEQDLWYIDNWSLWLDLKIVVGTVGQVFRSEPVPVEDTMNIERHQAAAQAQRHGTDTE
jgi:lipopolysaccharide/colanic/teichoic acid biosynthesis glycosyltransferase